MLAASARESKDDGRDGTHSTPPVRSSYLLFLVLLLSSSFSSKLNLLPCTLFFAVYWPLKHLEMHTTCKHTHTHAHTDVFTRFTNTKREPTVSKVHSVSFSQPWACHLFPRLICFNAAALNYLIDYLKPSTLWKFSKHILLKIPNYTNDKLMLRIDQNRTTQLTTLHNYSITSCFLSSPWVKQSINWWQC